MLFKSLTVSFTSGYLKQILNQFSKAVLLTANGDWVPPGSILHILRDLAKLESRPPRLTAIAYEWCSDIYANREKIEDWKSLLLVCLELGFRHLDPGKLHPDITLTHTQDHWGLVDVVFKSENGEAIADFLHAWTVDYDLPREMGEIVGICTGHLVGLHDLVPFSPRLRRLVIRFVERASYKGFAGAGVEKLIELLNHLHVAAEEMDRLDKWASLLLDVIRSPEGIQRLSHRYWEFLAEPAVWVNRGLEFGDTDALKIPKTLIDAQEWDKLECWIGVVWMFSESARITEEDLEHSTLLLFRQRPGAPQRLEQWMERWSKQHRLRHVPESFQRILAQAHETVQRQDAP